MSSTEFDLPSHLQSGPQLLPELDSGRTIEALGFILKLIRSGNFIQAIKVVRSTSGYSSLMSSKKFCEMLRACVTPDGTTLQRLQDEIAAGHRAAHDMADALDKEIRQGRAKVAELTEKVTLLEKAKKPQPTAKSMFDQLASADLVRQTFEANYNVVAGGLNIFGVTIRKLLEDLLLAVGEDDSRRTKKTGKEWRDWFLARIGMASASIAAFNEILTLFQEMGVAVTGRTPDSYPASSKPVKDAKQTEMDRRRQLEQDWQKRLKAEAEARRVDPFSSPNSPAKSPYGFRKH